MGTTSGAGDCLVAGTAAALLRALPPHFALAHGIVSVLILNRVRLQCQHNAFLCGVIIIVQAPLFCCREGFILQESLKLMLIAAAGRRYKQKKHKNIFFD